MVKDNEQNLQRDFEKCAYTFKENELLVHIEQPNVPAVDEKATFKLDSTKTPRQIDIVPQNPEGGKGLGSFNGIYELEGNTLPHSQGDAWRDRPTEFATRIGVVTLRRKIP